MVPILLILRPQPGADATLARAREKGLEAVVAPLFTIRSVEWDAPDPAELDALLLTSANAARETGPALRRFAPLPCYAIGEATAAAAREAGMENIIEGPSDGAALLNLVAQQGVEEVLHLCGRDHIKLEHPHVRLTRRIVYAAEPVVALTPEALGQTERGALVLIHSPRAGALFSKLVDEAGLDRSAIVIAAISEAAFEAAGTGWKTAGIAAEPRDHALLELAAKLCKTKQDEMGSGG